MKKESNKWSHHGKETLKAEYGRPSAPGADSWHLESAATKSNLPDSRKDVSDAKRRESEWKKR